MNIEAARHGRLFFEPRSGPSNYCKSLDLLYIQLYENHRSSFRYCHPAVAPDATGHLRDDVFGGDPTVIELERYTAELLGKEAGLYVPSGTMGNQICLKAHSQPGWELICDRECHVVNYEVGGPVVHSNLLVNLITTKHGMIPADVIRNSIRPKNIHCPETRMVALENTHNHHGGTILPQEEILQVKEVCDEFGLIFHLDGARIWNVHVATKIPLPELTAPFDSVSVCLSKGLGAPVGSVVAGPADFVEKCRRERKLFGGGMRQVGIIAAAGLYAVKNNIPRLSEDHANARYFAETIDKFECFSVEMERVQTNIVLVNIVTEEDAGSMLERMKEVGVMGVQFGPKQIRFVAHLDVNRADFEDALDRIKSIN
jgi:threonine aldolase